MTLLDLGGVFVLFLLRSQVDRLADTNCAGLSEHGETLDSILNTLREERQRYAE